MAAVHPQPSQDPLPPGWECRYDPRTGRYYFLNHVEHITTWEDPRLRYPQVQQTYPPYYGAVQYPVTASVAPPPPPPPHTVASPAPVPAQVTNGSSGGYYSTPRPMVQQEGTIQVDERTLMKLCLQFPTVEEGHIWQLLKQYHNREHVVVSALLAEGHPRAQTHSMVHEHLTPKLQRQTEAPVFQVDEALYHKLRNFFPAVDGDHIRNLQKIHNNQEHEVIAALVAGNRGNNSRHQSPHPSSPKMKLRYLKLVFPEVDEAVLFDVLNNCDNNAQEASNRLIGMGYKKRDTPITRPNSSQPLQRPMSDIPRPSLTPERPIIVVPPSASDKLQLVSRLQEQFPAISRTLVNMALDSSNYNEDRAKQFLTAMTPQDGGRSAVPQSEAIITTEIGGGTMQVEANQLASSLPSEAPPVPPRSRHASASQESDTPSGSRHSSTERHSLRGDSSREGTPSKSPSHRISTGSPAHKLAICSTPERSSRPKFKKEVMKISKATSTQDDHENMSVCRTRPKGPDPSLRKGPCDSLLLYVPSTLLHGSNNVCMHGKEYMPWIGPDPKNRKGPDPSLWRGPDPSNLGARNENRAKGPQRDLRRGPLANITHSKISSTTTTNLDAETDNSRSS